MYSVSADKLIFKGLIIFFICIFIISLIAKNEEFFDETFHKKNIEIFEKLQKLEKLQNNLIREFLISTKKSISIPNEVTNKVNEVSDEIKELTNIIEEYKLLENTYIDFKKNEDKKSKDNLFKIIRPRALTKEEKTIKFEERFSKYYIGGIPSSLKYIIKYMEEHKEYSKMGGQIPNKILLYGNPGNGKTYLPEILSEQLQIPLIAVSATTLQSKYYGETSKNVFNLIDFAKAQNEPIILLIDEIDAIARDRSDDKNETDRSSVNALLTALQKIDDNKNVFIFITTNCIDILDTALKDRFETCEIKDLSLEQRTQFIMKTFRDYEKPVDVEFAKRFAEVISNKLKEKIELKGVISDIYISSNPHIEPAIVDSLIGLATIFTGTPNIPSIVNAGAATVKAFCAVANINDRIKPKVEYVPHKVTPSKYWVSNRDIKRIIFTAVMAQKIDCKENSKNCNNPMCQYVRTALDELRIWNVRYAEKPTYCCGI